MSLRKLVERVSRWFTPAPEKSPRRSMSLRVEMLEDRMVPSTAALANGILTVTGDSTSDQITIDYQNSRLVVQHNGRTDTFNPFTVTAININSGGGGDTIKLERLPS